MRYKNIGLFFIATSYLLSNLAAAVPVQISNRFTDWHFDTALLVPSEDYAVIGDCAINCTQASHSNNYFVNTPFGTAVSRLSWDSAFTQAESDAALSLSYRATAQYTASVPQGLTGARAAAGVGLGHFIVNFNVLEPVLFTGSTGLSPGVSPFRPVTPTIGSGQTLDPGAYFSSLSFDKQTVFAQPGQNFDITRHFDFDFNFARISSTPVPVPPTLPLLLVAFAMILVGRLRLNATGRA